MNRAGFSPGHDLGIFTLGPFTCGIAICYDLRFPDLFRLYAQKGSAGSFCSGSMAAKADTSTGNFSLPHGQPRTRCMSSV